MRKTICKLILRPVALVISCALMIFGLSEVPQGLTERRKTMESSGLLTVQFLDVGQADAALLIADGEAMLIDGGNVADSSLIVSALRKNGISHLTAVVCTHAHEDHVGGLAAALKTCTADMVYAPVTEYDSKCFSDFVSYAEKREKSITVPQAGDGFSLGTAAVRFLSPVPHPETTNDTSLVLRVEHGEHAFLFMGDAERSAELQLLDAALIHEATVLKVGHHGSDNSTSYVFLREVMPEYAVISVEKGNSYGLPDEVVLSRLADAGSIVYRTDQCGEITMRSDGSLLTVETERAYDAARSLKTETEERNIPHDTAYIGNRNSLKFHRTTCRSLPAEKNSVYFSARADAVAAGYSPCGQCNP